jgi:hypothetical protein
VYGVLGNVFALSRIFGRGTKTRLRAKCSR